jgi:hypothetical protein
MRKIVLSFILLISITSYSQIPKFIFGGLQGNTARYTIDGNKQDASFKIGGIAGFGMKIPFEGRLSFVPLLYYSLKGYKVDLDISVPFPDPAAVKNNTTLHCVELAGLLQHDFTTAPEHYFFRLGPSLDFQLFGTEEYSVNNGPSVKRDMPFGFDKYGHYSANALAHFGYEKNNNYFVFAYYSFGLASTNNNDYGPEIRHRNVGVAFGIYLKKK